MKIKKCGKPHLNDSLLFAFVNPLSYDCRISFTLQQGSPSKADNCLRLVRKAVSAAENLFFVLLFFLFSKKKK
jgi:hypothetical protein